MEKYALIIGIGVGLIGFLWIARILSKKLNKVEYSFEPHYYFDEGKKEFRINHVGGHEIYPCENQQEAHKLIQKLNLK